VSRPTSPAPYVAPDPEAFPLPTERDLPALCAYLEMPSVASSVLADWKRCLAQNFRTWAAVSEWISQALSFDPERLREGGETFVMRARQVRWLAQLLADHYQDGSTAEKSATRFGLKSRRDYWRKLDLAHTTLAAGVLGARAYSLGFRPAVALVDVEKRDELPDHGALDEADEIDDQDEDGPMWVDHDDLEDLPTVEYWPDTFR